MDIGKLNTKVNFVEGYDNEPFVIFKIKDSNEPFLKIWEGLISDLLENPDMSGNGWKGLTRDYHELKGIWADGGEDTEIDAAEYLSDLAYYVNQSFSYEETAEMLESLIKYLSYAKEQGFEIMAKFIN
ncbi:hypothetical protein [Succinimonas amylolytica]|uniref:hypothetical protein n=1 Tax=Succinimonas amylolytica TaxID=83769 RepID=UPI00037A096F|nr:hypothetical protein [Succinimonas amylolytica]